MRSLKVYSWKDHRKGGQVYAIVAASSKAEVARLTGHQRPSQLSDLQETGNETEIKVAMARPGVIHWVSLRGPQDDDWKTDS